MMPMVEPSLRKRGALADLNVRAPLFAVSKVSSTTSAFPVAMIRRSLAMTAAACAASGCQSASVWPSTMSALFPMTARAAGLAKMKRPSMSFA